MKMSKSQHNERYHQKAAIKEWVGLGRFAQNIHPSHGMKLGVPDAEFLWGPFLIPIEFKLADTLSSRCIRLIGVRPLQRRWHYDFRKAGGVSGIIAATDTRIFAPTVDQFISGRETFDEGEIKEVKTYQEAIELTGVPLQELLQQQGMEKTAC